ncbi:asparagine synthase (glutamine-hydrolyzing) [Jatrophihabitans lederbergiae]|uniref:asparagine synthase (glutamine-hydrolyzing) n=1 Tax=Jatrophihabitans lederbergiae TaxID=3075547 RepID=A0ABU2J8U1_9ACTN|nr:asparagine synthase (glutamine-hydrolyzing) [Jatrophihabitans sp. DSM 44399]MDT0261382.1 asparagine synthase (glutamine-hydrolyzing) [Jatrophihabitans sp. DSM 44399]
MCGLIGFLAAGPGTAQLPETIRRIEIARDEMRHRGPDDGGIWSDQDVVIGFRRLSLIDWEHSHQPLPYLQNRYHLIFNGEIYNYLELRERLTEEFGATFSTNGDGEAIVAGYHYLGEKIVELLRGMFSFLIWDSEERVMFGARDWFGIKPLYTYTDERGSFFASDKKALLSVAPDEVSQDVNTEALQHYLTLQYVPEPASMHSRITRIDSGSCFTVRPGEAVRTRRYFTPDFPIKPVPEPEKLYHEIAEVLRDSVAKHMRSDFTVGAFLSGGIDSTAIAALAKEHNPKLLTFTTGFEREGFSEIDVAAESAAAIGAEHITKVVTPQEMMDTLPLIIWYLDDPVADPALVPLYFIAREARKHVKVVLSGEGADELFGGYTIYREPISLRHLTAAPDPVRRLLGSLSKSLPEGMRGKDLLRRSSIGIEERYYGNARIFRSEELATSNLLKTYSPKVSYTDVTAPHYAVTGHLDDSTRMQYVDLFTWLRGDILVKADKMTMANSLELRVPFLDTEVFRAASTIPVEQKLTKETTKYALRRALAEIVPPHVLNRAKLGFPVPTRPWLRDVMYDWARDIITSAGTGHLIDTESALALLDAHRDGPHDYSRKIWTLLVFMIWHGIFVEGRIKPEIPQTVYPVAI